MKKNFFKKLSFVLALAMIVSTIAPAAGAFAAAKPALSTTSKTLLLGEAGSASYDFNFKKGTVTGMKATWSSSNAKVAKVDAKTGLTKAVGAGSATIKAKVTKAGKTVATVSAKVTVKSNMKTIAIADPGKVSIAKATTLAYTYKTYSGATKGSTSVVKWSVDKTGATVTDKGVFTATAPGTYVVTAKAYTTSTTTAVKATAKVSITVAPAILSVKQTSLTKFDVTFDCDVSKTDVAKTAYVAKVVNNTDVTTGAEKVKSATLDSTGKVLTVEVYSDFAGDATYKFIYGDLKDTFTAAKTGIENVTAIVFADATDSTDNLTGLDLTTKVSGANADGVVIMSGTDLAPYLTFEYKGDLAKGYVSGSTVNIYTNGYTAQVAVKYSNYIYDSVAKNYKAVTANAVANITGVATSVDNSTIKYAVLASGVSPSSTTTYAATATIAAEDQGYHIVASYKNNTDSATTAPTVTTNNSVFVYETTNPDKLIISGTTLFPSKEGVVTVLVKDATSKSVVGSFDVTIQAKRTFAGFTVDNGTLTVGDNSFYADDYSGTKAKAITTTISVQDSLGQTFIPTVKSASISAGPTGVRPTVYAAALSGTDAGKVKVYVYGGASTTLGSYTAKITLNNFGVDKDVYIAVIVLDGSSTNAAKVANYRVELSDTAIDFKDITAVKNNTVEVYGYNAAGVRVDHLTWSATPASTEYEISVKNASGTVVSTNQTIPVVGTTGGTILDPYANGTYSVTVTATGTGISGHTALNGKANGYYLGANAFTVSDTSTKVPSLVNPVVKVNGSTDTIKDAVLKAFDLSLNGTALDETNGTVVGNLDVNYSTGASLTLTSTTNPTLTSASGVAAVYVKSITYKVTTSGIDKIYTFDVNATFSVKY